MNKHFNDRKLSPILNSLTGFTMTELVVVMALMSILVAMAFSQFRTPNEQIGCKAIYSAMQYAKMRAISTGDDVYVDFSPDTGNISDNFFTVWRDLDDDATLDTGTDEPGASGYPLPDSSTVSGVSLPNGVQVGFSGINNAPTNDPAGDTISSTVTSDGSDFNQNRASFDPKGTSNGGTIYLFNTDDSLQRGCMISALTTGIIRMSNWDGNWSNTW